MTTNTHHTIHKETTSNLPTWRGAKEAYSKAYRVLARMAKTAPHLAMMPSTHSRRSNSVVVLSDDMECLINALNKGDEETIKGYNLKYHDRDEISKTEQKQW